MKFTKKTVIEINYGDLDELITDFLKSKGFSEKNFDKYGYECVAENEWGNDQSHSFTVSGEIGSYTQKKIDEKDYGSLSTYDLLDWICAEKGIDPGEYLVDVCW